MTNIVSQIDIATAPHEVWAVLTDFASYGAWNPFITRIDGACALGTEITVHIGIANSPAALPVKAEIVTLRADEELVWRSHLVQKGWFDRDHIFRIERNAGGCSVTQTQTFSGPIAPFAGMLTEGVVRHGLERMNAALKKRVERTGA